MKLFETSVLVLSKFHQRKRKKSQIKVCIFMDMKSWPLKIEICQDCLNLLNEIYNLHYHSLKAQTVIFLFVKLELHCRECFFKMVIALFLLQGCNLSCIVNLFAALHESLHQLVRARITKARIISARASLKP